MDFETYKSIIQYHQAKPEGRDVIPPNLSRVEKATFRRKASLYSFKMRNFYRDGKIVLKEKTIVPVQRAVHGDDLSHKGGSEQLDREVRSKYFTESLREYCRDVSFTCEECAKRRAILLSDGPMKHLSLTTRRQLCERLGLNMGKTPVNTEDCGTIDLSTHEPIKVECARPKSSCFLDCLHYLLTGKQLNYLLTGKQLTGKHLNRVVFWTVYIICSPGNSSRDLNRFISHPFIRVYRYWTEEFSSQICISWRNSSVCIFTNIGTKKKALDGITSRGANAVGMARRQSTCTTASRQRGLKRGRDIRR